MKASYQQFHSIVEVIKRINPDVIFLQEVTDISLRFLEKELRPMGYQVLDSKRVDHHFIVTAINTNTVSLKSHRIFSFSKSRTNRHLLVTEIEYAQNPLHLINAHLESIKEMSEERSRQFNHILKTMRILKDTAPVVFAGDTNLMDIELTLMGGLPDEISDAWEFLGKPANSEFTWSTNRNYKTLPLMDAKSRFDRVLFTSNLEGKLIPKEMTPLGKEKLVSGFYPSDHIGLYVSFELH